MGIRFSVDNVRSMGRTARGVKGISLKKGDLVTSMDILKPDNDIFVVTDKGFGKRTDQNNYRLQSRAGKGIKLQKATQKTGNVRALRVVSEKDVLYCAQHQAYLYV